MLVSSNDGLMTPADYESIKQYVGFDETDERLLSALLPLARPHFQGLVDDFYTAIQAHPGASAAITGGTPQVERLKGTLTDWLSRVLAGPHDEAYLARHANIGRVHVRIRLPQQFMFTAINRIRTNLTRVAYDEVANAQRRQATVDAIGRVLDLELAVMLDTYRTDLIDQMRAQERLATVGEMAATVAHELRNPLGTIQSSLYLAQRQIASLGAEDPILEKHCQRIADQVELCGSTISNLLELAKNRRPLLKRFDMQRLLERAVATAELPKGIRTTLHVDPAMHATADPDQLNQVLVNLLTNAAEAMSGSGSIEVDARPSTGGFFVSIKDDGPGISRENRGRIFNALFTTKAMGTGLGLGLCRKIIDAHMGSIRLVDSERGAHFRIWLPDVAETQE